MGPVKGIGLHGRDSFQSGFMILVQSQLLTGLFCRRGKLQRKIKTVLLYPLVDLFVLISSHGTWVLDADLSPLPSVFSTGAAQLDLLPFTVCDVLTDSAKG